MVNMLNDNDTVTDGNPPFKNGQLMFGIVSKIDENNHQVWVTDLQERDFPWGPLSVMTAGSYDGGSENIPKVGTLVAWIPFSFKQGIVLGRVIEEGAGASDDGKTYHLVKYPDGKGIKYDRDSNTFSVTSSRADLSTSDVRLGVSPTESAVLGQQLVTILNDLITAILSMTQALDVAHLSSVAPPVNAADFITIQGQLNNILAQQVKVK